MASLQLRTYILNNKNQTTDRRRRPTTVVSAVNGLSVNGHTLTIPGAGLRVAFQGAPGAYSEFAAKTAVSGCSTVPCPTFQSAAAAVSAAAADLSIIPVESTASGPSLRNYDLLLQRDLRIAGELNLFVDYCLLAMPGVRATELRRVISHPLALANCGRSLAHLGLTADHCEPVNDTAGAVELLRSRGLVDTAAIASPRAASLYGLDVLAQGIQDESWNVTRFLLLAPPHAAALSAVNSHGAQAETRKTSIVVAHRGGQMMVMLKVLSAFSSKNINLTKLEVINEDPVLILDTNVNTLRAFPHVLYVDFEGSPEDKKVKEAIEEIEKVSVFVRILGCYAADPNIYDLH